MDTIKVTPTALAQLTEAMRWYDAMPEYLNYKVGDRFHENFRMWQESVTPKFFDADEFYLSHFEIGLNGEPIAVVGSHEGGGGEGDLKSYMFVAE